MNDLKNQKKFEVLFLLHNGPKEKNYRFPMSHNKIKMLLSSTFPEISFTTSPHRAHYVIVPPHTNELGSRLLARNPSLKKRVIPFNDITDFLRQKFNQ